jgi:dTDP-glucose 4,6-dehydratase
MQVVPRTVLVTGGCGFIGANLVQALCRRGDVRVVNLDKLTYAGNPENLAELPPGAPYEFVRGDIGDAALMAHLLEHHRPEAILNLAAESHVDRSIHGPAAFVETNLTGTFQLLEAARAYYGGLKGAAAQAFRFLHVSTDEVYGSLGPQDPAFTERTAYQPNSPYSASKAGSDHLVRAYFHTYGLPTLVTNCSNNYGPYQHPEKLVPLVIFRALEGQPLPVYGDGKQVRDWLYVEDHCKAILRVLERGRPGETYNIGGRSERTNLQVVQAICDILDQTQPPRKHAPHARLIQFVADRPGHDRRYAVDCAKIRSELDWRPEATFESGLTQTVHWYLRHGTWLEHARSANHQDWLRTNYQHRVAG